MNQNPIIELNELCQAKFGDSITSEVLGKTGPDHCPTVSVVITLPTGEEFKASGSNKRVAKQSAAIEALKYMQEED